MKTMDDYYQLSKTEIYGVLNAPSYTLADASRLCGISKGRVSRWLRGYEYNYFYNGESRNGSQESVINRINDEKSTYVSFLELIDLLFVKRFLERGFTLQRIRVLFSDARNYLDSPHFASSHFILNGMKVFLGQKKISSEATELIALLTGGQLAFSEIVEPIGEKIDFEDITGYSLATRWYPNGKNGYIVVDPSVSFGQPTIIDTRVTTDNVYDLYLGESKNISNVSKWYNITKNQVNSAVYFEQRIHA